LNNAISLSIRSKATEPKICTKATIEAVEVATEGLHKVHHPSKEVTTLVEEMEIKTNKNYLEIINTRILTNLPDGTALSMDTVKKTAENESKKINHDMAPMELHIGQNQNNPQLEKMAKSKNHKEL